MERRRPLIRRGLTKSDGRLPASPDLRSKIDLVDAIPLDSACSISWDDRRSWKYWLHTAAQSPRPVAKFFATSGFGCRLKNFALAVVCDMAGDRAVADNPDVLAMARWGDTNSCFKSPETCPTCPEDLLLS